jgi:hypothetical protein
MYVCIVKLRCYLQVKVLQEEKMTLLSEVARLTAAQAEAGAGAAHELDDAGGSLGPAHAGTLRYSNMRAQLDTLKDELDKVELQRDDQRARADVLERDLALTKLRNEELQASLVERSNSLYRLTQVRYHSRRLSMLFYNFRTNFINMKVILSVLF